MKGIRNSQLARNWFSKASGKTIVLGPVVRKVDSAIQRINLYPLDSAIGFPNTYPRDSDLSGR